MIDLQVVFVREIAELTDIKLSAMVRIDDEPIDAISDIQLNGVSSSFFPFCLLYTSDAADE